jgi:hypothetical protein
MATICVIFDPNISSHIFYDQYLIVVEYIYSIYSKTMYILEATYLAWASLINYLLHFQQRRLKYSWGGFRFPTFQL